MAPDRTSRRRGQPSTRPPTSTATWPDGPVPISTGSVELHRDRDDPSSVTLYVNGVPSSHLDLADPTRLEFEYMQQMAVLVDRVRPAGEPLRVVHLGAAGCTFARYVHATRPGSQQTAIELDTTLPELVRAWFDLPRSPALRIRAGDARQELGRLPDVSADVVIRDVFAGDRTPDHVATRQFVREVARVLRPGGLYLANCADRPPLVLARAEVATARAVLDDVALVAEPGQLRGRRYGNLVVAGTRALGGERTDLLGSAGVARALQSLPSPARVLHAHDLDAFVGDARPLDDPRTPDNTSVSDDPRLVNNVET